MEPSALERAEEECLGDEEVRVRRRERDAERRTAEDVRLVEPMSERILAVYPGCPVEEAKAIAAHTAVPGSGRVGRTAAGRVFDPDTLRRAVVAAVRHRHTNYVDMYGSLPYTIVRRRHDTSGTQNAEAFDQSAAS